MPGAGDRLGRGFGVEGWEKEKACQKKQPCRDDEQVFVFWEVHLLALAWIINLRRSS